MPSMSTIFAIHKTRPMPTEWEIRLIGIPASWNKGPEAGQGGYQFRQLLEEYQPRTVGAASRLAGRLEGMNPSTVRAHLWWAYANKCLEINGEAYSDGSEVAVRQAT